MKGTCGRIRDTAKPRLQRAESPLLDRWLSEHCTTKRLGFCSVLESENLKRAKRPICEEKYASRNFMNILHVAWTIFGNLEISGTLNGNVL